MGNQEQLTSASESDGSDDDSDQELRRVLKHLGVMRLGGRWQKREEWQEERASPNDSFSSSESSDAEDADIDRKMDALPQGSQKILQFLVDFMKKWVHFMKFRSD